jgi:CheY-like chemotaxis protein
MVRIFLSWPQGRKPFGKNRRSSSCPSRTAKLPIQFWFIGKNTKTSSDYFRKGVPFAGRNHDQQVHPHANARISRRPSILAVADDIALRTMLTAGLWRYGFIVWLAGNGRQAIELYTELQAEIDMVLLTVCMPGLDGPHTLAALQKVNPRIRCSFLAGDIGNYTEEELLEQGALYVFRKPLNVLKMAYLLRKLMNSRVLARRNPNP